LFVFVCVGCGAELTTSLSRVALPAHAHQKYGNAVQLPVLMESGTFAVDPEVRGPQWRGPEEIDPDETAAPGVHTPAPALSDAMPGPIVIAPGDVRGTVLVPNGRDGFCCGLDGREDPNMACERCGLLVASRIDDCAYWQAVWLVPETVRRLPVGDVESAPSSWTELMVEAKGTPPIEPIATWGWPTGLSCFWSWSPQWESAAGRALAHLVVASEGRPVTVPDGLVGQVFQRALDILLPASPPSRRAVLAGPGLPILDADAEILLVPVHPQTGETWTPADPASSAYPVPLSFGVWLWMAFPKPHLPLPASGRMPDGVLRDDPPTPWPGRLFMADEDAFRRTLERLSAVRSPWLREILDNLTWDVARRVF